MQIKVTYTKTFEVVTEAPTREDAEQQARDGDLDRAANLAGIAIRSAAQV